MFRRNCCSLKVLLIATLALLVIFVGVLVLSFVGIPLIVNNQVESSVQLQKGTIQWDRFVEIPFELDFKVWLFDITNPEDIMNGAKPVLKEVGPYAYKEKKKRNILDTDDTDDTVIYEQELSLEFDESLSGDLKEDDELTLLNPVLLSMSQETNVIERMVLGGCLERIFPPEYNTLFIKIKVRTVLFEGFEFAINSDDVGVACGIVRKKILDKTLKARNIEQIKNGTDENEITSLRFSLLNYRINQPDGMYGVNRGLRDVSQLGNIMRWNNDTKLPFWGRMESINNDTCNKVRGTDSTIYPPYITNDQSLEIFSTDICRIITIFYDRREIYKGITGYRFEPTESTLRAATSSPENDCFCTKNTANEDGEPSCFLDGVLDLRPCVGVPILLSFPHFLYADEKYINGVSGLEEADENVHKIYLLVEPNTGTPLEGRKRVQFNAILRPASFLDYTENLPNVVLPMFWVEEGASLPQKYIDELNEKFFDNMKLVEGVKYGLIAVTLACVITSTGFLIRKSFLSRN